MHSQIILHGTPINANVRALLTLGVEAPGAMARVRVAFREREYAQAREVPERSWRCPGTKEEAARRGERRREEEEEEAVRDMVDVDAIKEDEGRMKERRGRGGRNEAKLVNVDVGVIRDRKPFYQ